MRNLLLALTFSPVILFAQQHHQERTILIYNATLGGFTSGIGAVINKPKNAKVGKTFVRGFWQGSIGGLLNYAGKKTAYLIHDKENKMYALPATILHSAGFSIMENAALNEPFLENWNVNYALIRFDFSINSNKKFKARLLPTAVYATLLNSRLGTFDLTTSLLTGMAVYKNDNFFINVNGNDLLGYSLGRSFAYVSNYTNDQYHTAAHELIHTFQFREYQILNSWMKPIDESVKSNTLKKLFSKYVYFDFPYFWAFYNLEGRYPSQYYYRNFFEFEAERIATNEFVPTR